MNPWFGKPPVCAIEKTLYSPVCAGEHMLLFRLQCDRARHRSDYRKIKYLINYKNS